MDYLGKGEMLTNRDVNKFVPNFFVKYKIEHFWDILFQLMKHGTNIFYVVIMYGNIL